MTDVFEMMSRKSIESPMSLCNSVNLGATPCKRNTVSQSDTEEAQRAMEKNFDQTNYHFYVHHLKGYMKTFTAALVFFFLILGTVPVAAQGSGYKVVDNVKIGGDGGWDYLNCDAAAHRLYISRGTHVQVFDMQSKTVIGDIPNTMGVHGIALAQEFGRGYTSNGRDSS